MASSVANTDMLVLVEFILSSLTKEYRLLGATLDHLHTCLRQHFHQSWSLSQRSCQALAVCMGCIPISLWELAEHRDS